MVHHYRVPVEGRGTHHDPARPENYGDVDADARVHYLAGGDEAVIAANAALGAYEGYEADYDADVYTAPEADESQSQTQDSGASEHVCEECGDTFDTAAALNGHQNAH